VSDPLRVVVVVGARPNFMKAAPVLLELRRRPAFDAALVHTGQHYDERMSDLFFRDLGMPRPDVNLDARSGTHGVQTAEVMVRFEKWLADQTRAPDLVIVFGDINSTVACSLVTTKAGIPLAHVEAGLRSFDRGMPEELNRLCTDALADVCYVTERSGMENLAREGKPPAACAFVGNTMIDSLLAHRERANRGFAELAAKLSVTARGYAVCTLHRPSNVDRREPLERILSAFTLVSQRMPVLWPAHPRFLARVREFGLQAQLEALHGVRILEPQGYLDFLALMDHAALVLTDSGGIQEEACVLKVPCVTLRENTERPSTLETGGNVLVGNDTAAIVAAATQMAALDPARIQPLPLWDGQSARRIADDLEARRARGEFTRRSE
jgi:UDP-N-acetylglucosamine 2-epimerase (non-hydrolysing)